MRHLPVLLLALVACAPAAAQYKVVGPDGKVTYTDRPPVNDTSARVAPLRSGSTAPPDTELPADLRQAVSRYPVTLYTAADCVPCDSGRLMLQQRGVPFTEKRVTTDDDIRAFEQISGSRVMPALSVGNQMLRSLNASDWAAYLDAAGYPKESRLPAGWVPSAPTPLVAPRPAAAAQTATPPRDTAEAPASRRPAPAAPPSTGNGTGIRF